MARRKAIDRSMTREMIYQRRGWKIPLAYKALKHENQYTPLDNGTIYFYIELNVNFKPCLCFYDRYMTQMNQNAGFTRGGGGLQ